MQNIKLNSLLIIGFLLLQHSGHGQISIKDRMTDVTKELLLNLRNKDTASILSLYDTSSSHIDKRNYRDFIKEDIVRECILYNMIVDKHGQPNLENLTFLKDPTNNRNIAMLPLLLNSDSSLNIKRCNLYLVFNADQYFEYFNKLVKFIIVKENIIAPIINDKITAPDINEIIYGNKKNKQDK